MVAAMGRDDGSFMVSIGGEQVRIRPKNTEELARDFNVRILERPIMFRLRPEDPPGANVPLAFCLIPNGGQARYWVGVRYGDLSDDWHDATLEPGEFPRLLSLHASDYGWGYGGSGPADLSLNILYYLTGDLWFALRAHQDFKWAYVAGVSMRAGGEIAVEAIDRWIADKRAEYDGHDPDLRFEWYEVVNG